jgi:hypothetical protein
VLADLEQHRLVGDAQAQPGADLCPGGGATTKDGEIERMFGSA